MNTTTKPQIEATTASRVSVRREAVLPLPVTPSCICGLFSISATFKGYMGRTRTAGPLTMVTAKNSNTRTPSASAMAIERWRRLLSCAAVRTIPSGSRFSSIDVPCAPISPLPDDDRRNRANDDLGEEDGEQREQIKDREGEQPARGATGGHTLAATVDLDREPQHAGAQHKRGDAVD